MKKFISILTLCCCISMSFTFSSGCKSIYHTLFAAFAEAFGKVNVGDSNAADFAFGITVGPNGTIYKTSSGDTIIYTPRNSGTSQNLNALKIQPTTFQPLVIAVGNNGTITRSTNLGENWAVSPQVTALNLFAVDISSATQHCAGDNGVLLISYNLGANWTAQQSGTTRNLKGIGMNGGFVVAVGEKGTILRTTNSGQNWMNVSLPDSTINLYCVSQRTRQNFNATNFYIAGSQGKIFKSTDNGATWSLKNSGTTNTLRSIFFSGNDSGAVSGDNGTVRITTNAGETWFSDPVFNGLNGSITSISEIPRSSKTFSALSNGSGLYLISEDPPFIGIKNISNEIPKEFSLLQNYPNPFNPVTNIQFQIKQSSEVKIVIYDVNGKELQTLVNQKLNAGTYSADWNAANSSSGVYFYKLTADDFTQTRKMVLVK
ncbi:MAG: T9SS type A sorting domain-containing protein [Ignavibacteria bacterium]|nr:T9SS type A sorting domain-containing protein [Ignavibacteria bacterium]